MVKRDPIKVYDARWEVKEFNDSDIHRLLEAVYIYGKYLGVDTVTIANDARLAGSSVMEQAVDLGMKSGLQVYLCADPVSTTQSYFMAFKVSLEHPNTLGITITASHNPANYIGIKITVPGTQAIVLDCGPLGGFSKIREIYHSDESLIPADGADLNIVNYTKDIPGAIVVGTDGDGDRIVFGDHRGILNAGFSSIPILKILCDLLHEGHEVGDKTYSVFDPKLKLKNKTMYGENSLVSILLFLKAIHTDSSMLEKLWSLQRQVSTTGEFNYCIKNNEIRDNAMNEVIVYFKEKKAMIETKSLEGVDLQGTIVFNGIDLNSDGPGIAENWYSDYFRFSITENNIFRSYLSSGDVDLIKGHEQDIIEICKKYSGREVE